MSTPDQQARALRAAWEYLLAVGNGSWPLGGNITTTRKKVRRILRHYPLAPEHYAALAWEDGWRAHKAGYLLTHNPHNMEDK